MKPYSAFLKWLSSGLVLYLIFPPAFVSAQTLSTAYVQPDETYTELKETQQRLQTYEFENVTLHRNYELTTQSLAVLTQSLAEANAEAELFRRQYANLKLRMEAIGLEVVTSQREGVEQRLLRGVRDLDLLQRQRDTLIERLIALAESVFRYLKSAPEAGDARTRSEVEFELRSVNEVLGNSSKHSVLNVKSVPPTLQEGSVVSVKEEWSLVVVNVGNRHGMRLGLPLTVVRGDVIVGRVRVVDVREMISGAIVEERSAGAGKIKIGDQTRVAVQEMKVLEK